MEVYVPSRGNRCLSVGNGLSIFYLEQQNAEDLVDWHLCNARRDWPHHGDVPVCVRYDRVKCSRIRSGINFPAENTGCSPRDKLI